MDRELMINDPALQRLVDTLRQDLGEHLEAVVLYGSAARGQHHPGSSDLNLILVLADLAPATLERLAPGLERWQRQGQPRPRLFTAEAIADAADVFPIELLDLADFRIVVWGDDPFTAVTAERANLRLQCERELREKLMRLVEGYVETHARTKALKRLLTESYSTFVALFRGCLRLVGDTVPADDEAVVAAYCARAGLDAGAFAAVRRLKRDEGVEEDLKTVFARYYEELGKAVDAVDRFDVAEDEVTKR